MAQLLLILDVTVVTIALPDLSADLGLARQPRTWVISGSTLAFGGLLLLGGRAADRVGGPPPGGRRPDTVRRGVDGGRAGPDRLALLAGRGLQGLAAALLSPSALSLVVRTVDGPDRDRALGSWSALGGGGAALGLLVGGLLTPRPGWPWVFLVNVPVGLLVAVSLQRALPPRPRQPVPGPPGSAGGGASHGGHRHPGLRLQNDRGDDAPGTGLLLLPVALATMAGSTIAGPPGPARPPAPGSGRAGGRRDRPGGRGRRRRAGGPGGRVGLAAAGTGAGFVVASAAALGPVAAEEAGLASGS